MTCRRIWNLPGPAATGLLLLLAAPVANAAFTCRVPGCPGVTVTIADSPVPGQTRIVWVRNGGAQVDDADVDDTSEWSQTGLGVLVVSNPGETWGSVTECSDLSGAC